MRTGEITKHTKITKITKQTKLFVGFIIFLCFVISPVLSAQAPIRLAIVEMAGDDRGEIVTLLRDSASQSFELVDRDLTSAAVHGTGYSGSLNMSRSEASALGRSIGCDFYILGKIQ